MTERPAHDEDCELMEPDVLRWCACSYRASLVKLERERDAMRQALDSMGLPSIVTLEAERDTLLHEREEDRAAIRALVNWMNSIIVTEIAATVRTEIHAEHAAAIARAKRPSA